MAESETEISKSEYEALHAFRHALRRFLRFSEEGARAAGLTAQQHQLLLAVKGQPGRIGLPSPIWPSRCRSGTTRRWAWLTAASAPSWLSGRPTLMTGARCE